jgi:hypothetical protein
MGVEIKIKTYSQEEVADVMRKVHSQSHIRKVKPVAQPNQRERHDMVPDQLLEVLARLLHAQQHDDGLLAPVRRLEEVVELDDGLVRLVGEPLVHAGHVEVPHGRARHDVDARGPQDAEVDGRVGLLHEAGLLDLCAHPGPFREGPEELLHDELAREGEHHGVEGHEGDVPGALAVLGRGVRERGLDAVGEEDEAADRVGVCREDEGAGEVGDEEGQEDGERDHPGVLVGVLERVFEECRVWSSVPATGLAGGAAEGWGRRGFLDTLRWTVRYLGRCSGGLVEEEHTFSSGESVK